jgi:gluconolactonase
MNDVEIIDPRFASYVMGNAPLEKLATGFRWVEGPVWTSAGDGVHCVSPEGTLLGKI